MNNTFECGKNWHGTHMITILRAPSDIPVHIDRALYLMALCSDMDGNAKRVVYRFTQPEEFGKAIRYLESYGWKQIQGKV